MKRRYTRRQKRNNRRTRRRKSEKKQNGGVNGWWFLLAPAAVSALALNKTGTQQQLRRFDRSDIIAIPSSVLGPPKDPSHKLKLVSFDDENGKRKTTHEEYEVLSEESFKEAFGTKGLDGFLDKYSSAFSEAPEVKDQPSVNDVIESIKAGKYELKETA